MNELADLINQAKKVKRGKQIGEREFKRVKVQANKVRERDSQRKGRDKIRRR